MAEQRHTSSPTGTAPADARLFGTSAMGDRIRGFDWSLTPLGPIAIWPAELLQAVQLCLGVAFPMAVHWGSDNRILYNDAWAELIGDKHPAALGQPAEQAFPDAWPGLAAIFASAHDGQTVFRENEALSIRRQAGNNEAYFTLSSSPLYNAHGDVSGVVTIATETTATLVGARRRHLIYELNDALRPLATPAQIQATAARVLAQQLGANRVHYAEVQAGQGYCEVIGGYADGMTRMEGRHRLADFDPSVLALLYTGAPMVVHNVFEDARLSATARARSLELSVAAFVVVPLIKNGELVAMLVVDQSQPRHWKESEQLLINAAAERTWAAIEQARAETARRHSELRFRQLADAMPQLVWVADAVGTVLYYNARASEYGGVTEQPDGSWSWADSVHADDREPTAAAWQFALATREPFQIEHRVRMADGSWRWHLSRGLPANDQSGNTTWFGTATDIQELRAANEALARGEALFRHLTEGIPHLVWLADAEGRLAFFNHRFDDYTGVHFTAANADQLLNDCCHPDDLPRLVTSWERAHATGQPFFCEHRIRNAEGDYHWFIAHAVPQRDERTGKILRWYGTTTDVHEQKLAEEALRGVNAQLVQGDRHKDEFLAVLAHELRNPLAATNNVLKLLDPAAFGESRRHLDILRRQTQILSGLVDDLLDVSRVTRGIIELKRERVDLAVMVAHALESVQALIDEKRHAVAVRLPEGPIEVFGDPLRLEQIITNLLNNAAKYTDPGGQLTVEVATNGDQVELTVADNGIGLDPALANHIFTLFGQDRRGLDRSQGGLGIGLTIVRQLVELHGGTVQAASKGVGRGAAFIISLPLATTATAPTATRAPTAEPPSPIRRILVVDDRQDVADTLVLLLESAGHQVWVAYDGADALVCAELHQPDLVLLDIGLPGMDGYEVARQLRRNPRTCHAVLAALTGYGQPADSARAEAGGFDKYFVKPVDFDALEAFIHAASVRRPS